MCAFVHLIASIASSPHAIKHECAYGIVRMCAVYDAMLGTDYNERTATEVSRSGVAYTTLQHTYTYA